MTVVKITVILFLFKTILGYKIRKIFNNIVEGVVFLKTEEFKAVAKTKEKKSPIVKDCILAFIIGGLICVVGQAIFDMYVGVCKMDIETAQTFTSISLVFLSAIFTGFGLYDKLAKIGGAGTLVPITGFANAMVSPALEFKKEGLILGTGVKMFSIAGPVIVYGTCASFIYGLIYYIIKMVA
ncbi:MAG: stage V sporulation protein AC [Clostridiales bacterium]|nr:MAG: stage V sporulation protein AC [Clostridiales bacterium]